MTEASIIAIGGDTIKTIIYIAGPLLATAMVIGVVISVLQAITQINEATLTFVPKMAAIVLVMSLMAPWMIQILSDFAVNALNEAGEIKQRE